MDQWLHVKSWRSFYPACASVLCGTHLKKSVSTGLFDRCSTSDKVESFSDSLPLVSFLPGLDLWSDQGGWPCRLPPPPPQPTPACTAATMTSCSTAESLLPFPYAAFRSVHVYRLWQCPRLGLWLYTHTHPANIPHPHVCCNWPSTAEAGKASNLLHGLTTLYLYWPWSVLHYFSLNSLHILM